MTRDQMHNTLRYVREQLAGERGSDFSGVEALDMVIAELEQEPKWDRLYSWLNDMRLGIAPDETVTDIDERNVRTAQVDLLDDIMEWIEKHPQEPKTGHWIYKMLKGQFCSICDEPSVWKFNYCPNCGCRMFEPQEERDKE